MEILEEPFQREILEIRSELREMRDDLKRFMERSNKDYLESILADFRRSFSEVLIRHVEDEIEEGLRQNMVEGCEMKEACKTRFQGLLKESASLIRDVDDAANEETIDAFRSKLRDLQFKAPYDQCERCFMEALRLQEKQIDLLRSMRIYETKDEKRRESQDLPVEVVVKEILEPLNSKQRLQILKALAGETKSFSNLSELTGLRGGNLLFHIQKLLDSGMILQQHERGDYMITEKGYRALLGISEVYSKLNLKS
ncbi:MAG TPA: winged helix-turn-helix transcriptional regulator [Methanotrichaceae archaeon]|nr:winged helix-turn-helix transcriptional regulator [Methanotrichaceae archaeon]